MSLERPLPAASCRSWLVLLSKAAAAIRSTLMALCRCRAVAGARRAEVRLRGLHGHAQTTRPDVDSGRFRRKGSKNALLLAAAA